METEANRQPPIYSVLFFQLIMGVFLMIALINRQFGLVLLTLLLICIMSGARLWSRMSGRRLILKLRVDRPRLFPREEMTVGIGVENRKWLPVRLRLKMEGQGGLNVAEDLSAQSRECGLLWFQQAAFSWTFHARKRGIYQIKPIHITTGDLFGFYHFPLKPRVVPLEVVVYPRIVPIKPVDFPLEEFFGVPGAKSPVQDPVYILGTRDYQPWGPARYIHWKASARHNRLQEKVFEPSAQGKVLFLIDVAGFAEHQAHDAFERILETIASLAVQCVHSGYAVGLVTNGHVQGGPTRLTPGFGPLKLSALLEVLARLQMIQSRPLIDVIRGSGFVRRGITSICCCHDDQVGWQAVSPYLRMHRIPGFCLVSRVESTHQEEDPVERDFPIITTDALGLEVVTP
jgi:uncharacterized protein (DUF58 family)